MPNTKKTRRLEVLLSPDDLSEVERRAAEERLKIGPHVRRLIAQDAAAHPAVEDLKAAA